MKTLRAKESPGRGCCSPFVVIICFDLADEYMLLSFLHQDQLYRHNNLLPKNQNLSYVLYAKALYEYELHFCLFYNRSHLLYIFRYSEFLSLIRIVSRWFSTVHPEVVLT